ncbi:tetraspanin-15-like [Apium graveolens]|uniref:tetraspanin-15-like n=1 Tax=Apium graveolens TaxID=4045 RepID=UPI003D7A6C91
MSNDHTHSHQTLTPTQPDPEPIQEPEPEPEPEPTPPPSLPPPPVKEETPPIHTEMVNSEEPKHKMKFMKDRLFMLAFLLSLPIIALIAWLIFMRDGYDCEYLLKMNKLLIGIISALAVLLVLNGVALFMITKPLLRMPALILVMIPVIVVFILGLGLVGGFKTESRSMPGSPQRLKLNIYDTNRWSTIKSCLYDKSICQILAYRTSMIKSYDYSVKRLSPVQSGCCRPPASCNMEYVNATYWQRREGIEDKSRALNSDCDVWTNQETILCYNCNSCKEGYRRTIGKKWIILGSLLISVASLLFIVHLFLFIVAMSESYGG